MTARPDLPARPGQWRRQLRPCPTAAEDALPEDAPRKPRWGNRSDQSRGEAPPGPAPSRAGARRSPSGSAPSSRLPVIEASRASATAEPVTVVPRYSARPIPGRRYTCHALRFRRGPGARRWSSNRMARLLRLRVVRDPFGAFHAQTRFLLDCQAVVALRMMRIAAGGEPAVQESVRMVSEKVIDVCGRADGGCRGHAPSRLAGRGRGGGEALPPRGIEQSPAAVAIGRPAGYSPPSLGGTGAGVTGPASAPELSRSPDSPPRRRRSDAAWVCPARHSSVPSVGSLVWICLGGPPTHSDKKLSFQPIPTLR